MRTRVRELPGLAVIEMATGHCPMVSEPAALTRHLLQIADIPASGVSAT